MINLVDLTGKRIIITGASQGIGQGTAILLSKLGAKLVLIARNEEKLKATLQMLDGDGHGYQFLDLGNLNEIEPCVKNIVNKYGSVDGLVYAAGIGKSRPLQLFKPNIVEEILKVNLMGFIEFTRCITKKKRFNEGMRIVAISSIAAFQGDKTHTIYSASKAGLDGAVRCLAKELSEKGICINTVAPAFIKTAMYDGFIKNNGQEAVNRIIERQYLGLGAITDVANSIAFLMSDAAKFITGVCLPVDGGATSN